MAYGLLHTYTVPLANATPLLDGSGALLALALLKESIKLQVAPPRYPFQLDTFLWLAWGCGESSIDRAKNNRQQ